MNGTRGFDKFYDAIPERRVKRELTVLFKVSRTIYYKINDCNHIYKSALKISSSIYEN